MVDLKRTLKFQIEKTIFALCIAGCNQISGFDDLKVGSPDSAVSGEATEEDSESATGKKGNDKRSHSDSNGETPKDTDTGNCECAADEGPCCDGCFFYLPEVEHSCDELSKTRCESGDCGANIEKNKGVRFCMGKTAECTGDVVWQGWIVKSTCSAEQLCVPGEDDKPVCQFATDCQGDNWVSIQGGTFTYGNRVAEEWPDELPPHDVGISSFEILRKEVTVSQYKACIADKQCTEPSSRSGFLCNFGVTDLEEHPINCVDWYQARDFCTWVGGRLPTEAEWEYAASGSGDTTIYPWGDSASPACDYAVVEGCGEARTLPVGSKPKGETKQGVLDMVGNVWEWTNDWSSCSYVSSGDVDTDTNSACSLNGGPCGSGCYGQNPKGPCNGDDSCSGRVEKVARGGSYSLSLDYGRLTNRYHINPNEWYDDLGIRCVR